MKHLFVISSMRSGSNMVRSILRDGVVDMGTEHAAPPFRLAAGEETVLQALKFDLFLGDCLQVNNHPLSCALVLYRADWRARAASLAVAQANGSWFGHKKRMKAVEVDWEAAHAAAAVAERNRVTLLAELTVPFKVIEYEDISISTVHEAASSLLGRDVLVVPPSTTKVSSMRYVSNP